jgi:HAAS domain-containing protein
MFMTEQLIDEILEASHIPSERRRLEVRRELRAHVEDFVIAGRQSGCADEEIERMVLERFGDPQQIAQQFACVYRRERAARYFGGFLMSTVAVSVVISAAVISLLGGVRLGMGAPVSVAFGLHHSSCMAFDVLASAAAYLGILTLGRLFARPLVVLAGIAAALAGVFVATGLPAEYIVFGFANGALLRGIQVAVQRPVFQLGAAIAGFGCLGMMLFPASTHAAMSSAVSWVMMGTAYHLMTHFAARLDRTLYRRF